MALVALMTIKASVSLMSPLLCLLHRWCTEVTCDVDERKANKSVKTQQQSKIDVVKQELCVLKQQLHEEKEKNIQLENYTSRENLRIMNLPEIEDNNIDTRDLVFDILQHELNLDVTNIRLHAAYRIGRPQATKRRPNILRFFCREDRDLVLRSKENAERVSPI